MCSSIASDEEFTLFSVVIFRRVHDEFIQKCRENKCINTIPHPSIFRLTRYYRYMVRDFQFSEDQLEKEREMLQMAEYLARRGSHYGDFPIFCGAPPTAYWLSFDWVNCL